MGKNHRHKKQLKSEKGKVKLRVKNEKTKFLPKGLNVTKTDFKIKSIILPEQLKFHKENELLSKRKLNIKDILSRLKHYNVSVRHDCCEELKHILIQHLYEVIEVNLSQILQGVAQLLLDRERKIRRDAIRIFEIILENTPVEKIEPFFFVLSSYLRCSMTNIDWQVQEDSLLFLDALLRFTPGFVANEREKILPNLFALISKFKSDSKPGLTLSVNLGSKLTSVKWRIQVLSRLYAFFQAIIAQKNKQKNQKYHRGCIKYAQETTRVPIFYNPYVQNDSFALDVKQNVESEDIIVKNLGTLTTLLYEIWLEVTPGPDMNRLGFESTLLSQDAAAILTCILNILVLLFEYLRRGEENNKNISQVTRNLFFTPDCKNFLKNVVGQFPFSQRVVKHRKQEASDVQKVLELNTDAKCVQENLLVAYLFSILNQRLQTHASNYDAKRFITYVNTCLKTRHCINEKNVKYLLDLLRVVFFENSVHWIKSPQVNFELFLNKFLKFFNWYGQYFKCKDEIYEILCDVTQETHLNQFQNFQKWLCDLPELLCRRQISAKLLNMLLLIGKQNNILFLQGLAQNLDKILGNFPSIKIAECDDKDFEKAKILHLFYYVPNFNSSEVKCLENFGNNCEVRYKPIMKLLLQKFV